MKRTWSQTQEYGQLGIIESVCLRNFMCHDNLAFDFDPHMNFIIGRNGSGKSAVLTGIILALGGKSGATGRHTNIKGFIKSGKHSATVSVTLKNCGPEAYRPKEYGEKITVERHFNSEGVSSYKIKSQSGQILSSSKEELINILSVMDIQIENPVTVLTQEISRNFLVSKNSKSQKLFQLFYSGTGLLRIKEDYNRAVQQKKEAEAEVEHKKAILPEMRKEIKHLKSLIDKSSQITDLKKELLWANVIYFEKERDKEEEALSKVKNKISCINRKIDEFKDDFSNVAQALTQFQADKRACSDKMGAFRKDLHEQSQKREALTSSIRETKGSLCRYKREVQRLSSEASSLENMINEIRDKTQNDVNQDKLEHEAKINDLKKDVSKTMDQISALDAKKNFYFESTLDLRKKIDSCQAELQDLEIRKVNIGREKQQLNAGMSNRIDMFGTEMKHLLKDIKQAHQSRLFKVEPKGPIGLYINVKDPNWIFAVQECLKVTLLKTFCCDNHADADQLKKIINKHFTNSRSKPSIITSKFVPQVFNVDQFKTKAGHPTVLDMLDIKDPVIANCLIDQKQIENILLVADHNAAQDLMMDQPPKYCSSTYTLNGDQICHSPYRLYSCRTTNQICMLRTVNQEDVEKKQQEYNAVTQELTRKVSNKNELEQELNNLERKKNALDNDFTNLRIKLKRLQMKLKDEENSYEEPKDINCLQSDLEKLQTLKENQKEDLESCEESLTRKNEELALLSQTIDRYKIFLQDQSETFASLSKNIDANENKKENLNSAIGKLQAQLNQFQPSLHESETKLRDCMKAAQEAEKEAIIISPRINTERSPEKIQQLLKETEETVQRQKHCDRKTLMTQYEEKHERYRNAESELRRQHHVNIQIDRMMTKRFEEFQKICINTSLCLTCGFATLLKENNFTGGPIFSFEKETLEIVAIPEKMNSKVESKQNLAQLSGGERSYVTIAFLLALWDRIHMPFRILDEYDVFMDANNRHLSINLLINTARANKNIQYIFLSPLELPPMADSSHVKVHKMPEPKR